MSLQDLKDLLYASFGFTVGAYAWAWVLYTRLTTKIGDLHKTVTNHQAHRLDDIEDRLARLERDMRGKSDR